MDGNKHWPINHGLCRTRTITQSGRVTPVGEVRMQFRMVNHTPIGTITHLGDGLFDAIQQLDTDSEDLPNHTESINRAASEAISYVVDPVVVVGSGFGLRYGMLNALTLGTQSTGTHVGMSDFNGFTEQRQNSVDNREAPIMQA